MADCEFDQRCLERWHPETATLPIQTGIPSRLLSIRRKSPGMILTFLGLWALCLLVYGPRLWLVIASAHNTPAQVALLAVYGLMLIIFWLFGAYSAAITFFALLDQRRLAAKHSIPTALPNPPDLWPRVAVLYPTYNDFQEGAVGTCLVQDYPGDYHVFLLDDSTDPAYQARVDAFHATHPMRTTVVRRERRHGFKAGNLNHALRGVAADYTIFSVVDADERLSIDFLRTAVVYLQALDIAFVQASHSPRPEQASRFAQEVGPTILSFYEIHCRPRNRHGLVLYVGHGAVIRRAAWEQVGGFPEVVLEDLAFTAALLTEGLRGVYLPDLRCTEDFPDTFPQFKRQYERYIIGVTEALCRHLFPLMKSRKASLIEKFDFCLWCSPLYMPALCLLFVVLCSMGLVVVLGHWKILTLVIDAHEYHIPVIRIYDTRFTPLWAWDFRLLSVACALAPIYGCLALGAQRRLHPWRLLAQSTMAYLSVMLISWRGILGYLLLKRTFSPPTGERMLSDLPILKHRQAALPQCSGTAMPWRGPRLLEAGLGVAVGLLSLLSMNVGHAGICGCLLMGVQAERKGWDAPGVRMTSTICFIAILFQMLLSMLPFGHIPGLPPMIFTVHF